MGTFKRVAGPVTLSNTYTTNIYNNASALVYDIIRRIHVVNRTGAAATFRLYLGATGANTAGTEIFFDQTVPANGIFIHNCNLRLNSTDFLVGGASAATTLTINIESDQNVV